MHDYLNTYPDIAVYLNAYRNTLISRAVCNSKRMHDYITNYPDVFLITSVRIGISSPLMPKHMYDYMTNYPDTSIAGYTNAYIDIFLSSCYSDT